MSGLIFFVLFDAAVERSDLARLLIIWYYGGVSVVDSALNWNTSEFSDNVPFFLFVIDVC